MATRLTTSQIIKLKLRGKVYLGHRRRPGWSGVLPFFAFECPIHGRVEGYPHGYNNRLDCPQCQTKSVHPELVEQVVEGVLNLAQ